MSNDFDAQVSHSRRRRNGRFGSVGASAAIACSGDVCWHTHEHYRYPPDAKVVIHEDNWRAGPHITFHEHEGRGYWRGSAWTTW
jgi:hypothetical protein